MLVEVDRRPYKEKEFYPKMLAEIAEVSTRMESAGYDSLQVGWSKVGITPKAVVPLAGYGGRKPKAYTVVHDSIFVRVLVFDDGVDRLALVSADLLIIHPLLKAALLEELGSEWSEHEVFLTATHTHASIGGWAPGLVGNLFSGAYDEDVVANLAIRMAEAIRDASANLGSAQIAYGELQVPELVKNRLVGTRGIIDPWLKTMLVRRDGDSTGMLNCFSAHATCLSRHFRELSGDFPGQLNRLLEESGIDFTLYAAGAVGSMGPVSVDRPDNEPLEVQHLASALKSNIELLLLLDPPNIPESNLSSAVLDLYMPAPGLKVTGNLQLRPWLFRSLIGEYPLKINVFSLGNTVFIGLPCDFSGELAVPLYQYARDLGFNLVITSFNGGYAGYVVKDDWYDLPRYESRTMSWYGPFAGSYLSEVIKLILDELSK